MSSDRSPKQNRIQAAREEYEARAGTETRAKLPLIDLIDGSFHRAGFRFPPAILQREFEHYLAGPGYRPVAAGDPKARAAIAAYYNGGGSGAGSARGAAGAASGGASAAGAGSATSGAVSPDDIILTASSSESYRLLFDQLCGPGDSVLLPTPGYPLFEHLAEHSRIQPAFYELHPEQAWLPDPAALNQLMSTLPRARAIVLISPNNPSGAVIGPARLEAIRAVAGEHGLAVILDEVFREFVYETPAAPPLTQQPETALSAAQDAPPVNRQSPAPGARALLVRINGISKMFACPDIKLGWIAVESGSHDGLSPAELVQRLEVAADVYLSASGPAQHLVPALFRDGFGFVTDMRTALAQRRATLLEQLETLGGITYVPPAGGIHCIVEIPGLSVDDEELAVRAVRDEGLFLHPGYLYGIQDRTTVVLSFLSHPDTIREAMARLRRVLRKL